ncbi:hypothetical protein ASD01_17035 [Ensifer sp. Root423]|nr:hypothetical protein ASD01_17035 [Ensifer sp. Root423]
MAGHFGADMAELLLHMSLVSFGRGGASGAQRMTGEFCRQLAFAEAPCTPAAAFVAVAAAAKRTVTATT